MDEIDDGEGTAAYIKVPLRTLDQWRYLGKGPRFIKVGRHVRYRRDDVDRWLDQQASGTPDAAA